MRLTRCDANWECGPDHKQLRSPYLFLILGIISFSLAVVWTCIGKARTRFQGWVYRAEEPNQFWF